MNDHDGYNYMTSRREAAAILGHCIDLRDATEREMRTTGGTVNDTIRFHYRALEMMTAESRDLPGLLTALADLALDLAPELAQRRELVHQRTVEAALHEHADPDPDDELPRRYPPRRRHRDEER
ncbi:hypothetical protein DW322_03405 [Rhodococcus rhodnii]|uniref:Uncharacterized protein n=2 Tax=Rhodococcus rhodnii TaxID=38312 RepID=R7WKS1_9NOCA|nr:hypothetical protein [Rhodococcus rhodnii]EOM74614.1 hypothetical protein Rrhod_4089 [Rhodococcus rhodnii LMG 5362]TXG89450.1 hypothetical protein DW322_03405 [Rhodococcus rhodnii]